MSRMSVRSIESYNIPQEYKDTIKDYINDCKRILSSNLKIVIVTGSCGVESVTEGFSDIDILIVTSSFNFDEQEKLDLARENYNIRIASTVLSVTELENKAVDDKTVWSLFLLNREYLNVNYKNSDVKLPTIEIEELIGVDKVILPGVIHQLKRLLYRPIDKKAIIKKMTIVMKVYLRRIGIIKTSYPTIFRAFSETFNMDYYPIEKELNEQPISSELLLYAKKLVESFTMNSINRR